MGLLFGGVKQFAAMKIAPVRRLYRRIRSKSIPNHHPLYGWKSLYLFAQSVNRYFDWAPNRL